MNKILFGEQIPLFQTDTQTDTDLPSLHFEHSKARPKGCTHISVLLFFMAFNSSVKGSFCFNVSDERQQ